MRAIRTTAPTTDDTMITVVWSANATQVVFIVIVVIIVIVGNRSYYFSRTRKRDEDFRTDRSPFAWELIPFEAL